MHIVGTSPVRSKVVVLLLLIHCLLLLPLFVWVCDFYAFLSVLSFLQSSGRERKSWLLYFMFFAVSGFGALCFFLTVSWVGLQCVIVLFS